MNVKRAMLVLLIGTLVAGFFIFDLDRYLNFEHLKAAQNDARHWVDGNFALAAVVFLVGYILIAALSLPGAALMTLFGGAIFGFGWGVLLVSFASSIGATLAMLSARYLLRQSVESRFAQRLETINQGLDKDGMFYLFSLRMVPLLPFFVVNLVMGLSRIKVFTFYWVSQLGMLAGTFAYVYAGTQLGQIQSLGDAVSASTLLAFAVIGLLPWVAKAVVAKIQNNNVYKDYKKPASFDRDMVVIGAGAGGLVAAYIANVIKAKVSLIEKGAMGGDCLNTGCVPSKALLAAAHAIKAAKAASEMGIEYPPAKVDFAKVKAHVARAITTIEPHDSVERYQGLGIDVIQGEAKIIDPWTVETNGQRLTSRTIVVATGGHPRMLAIEGIELPHVYNSDTLWSIDQLPQKLVIVGGGPIGCELAQSFSLLGSDVTIVDFSERLLIRDEPEASAAVLRALETDGVKVVSGASVEKIDAEAVYSDQGQHPADVVIVAVGREAVARGIGLEELGLLNARGGIEVDQYLRSAMPNILAVGDAVGGPQFTHAASHMAWYAVVNGFFGALKSNKVDYSAMPMVSYTAPEVARVGLTEAEAEAKGLEIEVTSKRMDTNDRSIAEQANDDGFIKIITAKGSDKILGVTIVDDKAGELIAQWTLAKRHGLGLNKIMSTIHAYPTRAELGKMAVGQWKAAHSPQWALKLAEKYFNWARS